MFCIRYSCRQCIKNLKNKYVCQNQNLTLIGKNIKKLFEKIIFEPNRSENFIKKLLSNADKSIKGALSGLRKFLADESLLKMMKNAFYFTSKALLVLKIYKFLSFALTF